MSRPIARIVFAAVVLSALLGAEAAFAQSASCLKPDPVVVGENPFTNLPSFGVQLSRSSTGFGEEYIWRAGWFAFTPDVTGPYTIGVCGANVDTKIALGAACPQDPDIAWNVLGYNDDACAFTGGTGLWASKLFEGNSGMPLVTPLVAGQTYLIAVGGYSFSTAPAAGSLAIDLAQPPSDPCADPQVAVLGMNALAIDPNTPALEVDCLGTLLSLNRANVLRFTAPYAGDFTANTCSQFDDTIMAVLRSCGDGATSIACNDDSCGSASHVTFHAGAGETVFITVGFYGTPAVTPATLPVEVAAVAPPANPCESIGTIVVGSNTVALDPGLPDLSPAGTPELTVHKVNYFAFTAPQAGVYRVGNCASSAFDSIFVRMGACNDPAAVIDLNDDGCGAIGGPSRMSFFSEAGATTLIGIGAWSAIDPLPASTVVSVSFTAPAADACATASVIAGVEGGAVVIPMSIAYRGLDLAGHCNPGPLGTDAIACARMVRYTPLVSGSCTIGTCSDADPTNTGRVDSRIAVLTACGDAASVLACDDDGCTGGAAPYTSRLTVEVAAGTTYYIAIGGFNEFVTGPLHLEIGVPVPPANPADINHDGRVDGTDLSMVLGAWGTTEAAADIDHDGHVGGSDLTILLGSWG